VNSPSTERAHKVLVTGAGGFIGSHLVADQLRRGRRVVALDLDLGRLDSLKSGDKRLQRIEADIGDPETLEHATAGVDVVYHLAAAHLGANIPEAEFRRVNVEAVRALSEACLGSGVSRLVHCSSVGVHGTLLETPASEDSECRPEIPYEKTKLEGEDVLLEAHRSKGLPVTILRPVWVYGPGCPRTEKLFRSIRKGRFVMGGKGATLRHCVYIRDMIEAFNLAAESSKALGRVLIVGDAGAVEVRQLVAEIASLTNARRPPSVPLSLLHGVGLLAETAFRALGREAPISRRSLKFFTGNTSFQIDRAREVLGYAPRFTISSGLRETNDLLERGEFWRLPLPDAAGS
jgi:nucleoside-diphosphate-sugar epimerase